MKKVFYFRNSYVLNRIFQLKAVAYKDGSQVLNGFKIAPTKKKQAKAWDFDSSCMHGMIKHQGYCR
jgi:hypothetical protein